METVQWGDSQIGQIRRVETHRPNIPINTQDLDRRRNAERMIGSNNKYVQSTEKDRKEIVVITEEWRYKISTVCTFKVLPICLKDKLAIAANSKQDFAKVNQSSITFTP